MNSKVAIEHDQSHVGNKKSKYTLSGAGLKNEGRNDKRSRRIMNTGIFTKGVETYRNQLSEVTMSAKETPPKPLALSRVLARPRPLFQYEAKAGEWDSLTRMPQGGLVLHEGTEQVKRNYGVCKILRHHIFDKVQAVSTDNELYDSTRDLLSQAVRGKMSTIFMYGMTGSGKTYSMAALHRKLPVDLFAQINAAKPEAKVTIRFHAYELLGKRCFDLADRKATKSEVATRREVFLRVDSEGRTNMCGMTQHEVESPDQLLEYLHAAVARRETSATGANATSSRSHAVYVLLLPGGGRLTLIDLAGSETAQETLFHTKEHMMQAKEINNSLATLRACLRARSLGTTHVPYRESTLTRVLKDALTDTTAATVLVACVAPACSHLEHSLRTLRTAMFLTGGRTSDVKVEEQPLKELSVLMGGPKKWSASDLGTWLVEQPFASEVILPEGMTGAAIMKLPRGRLKPICGDDADVAKAVFLALRVASKAAAKRDLELRRQLKNGSKQLDRAAGFAKSAPTDPKLARASQAQVAEALARKKRRAIERAKMLQAAKESVMDGDMTREEYVNWCCKNGFPC